MALSKDLSFFLFFVQFYRITSLDVYKCRTQLGMQSGEIKDNHITASSFGDESVGPAHARIRNEINGGAWCPEVSVTKETYEYLEIDFGELKTITLAETQGRFGNGQGQEFADQYVLDYQRENGGPWMRFRNRRGQKIIQGNTNTYIAELREIDPPIIARRLRFVPYSENSKSVCMRVELYGCDWEDGSVWYEMNQGERRGSEVDLIDYCYDGIQENGDLKKGLGQLCDGTEGQANFRLDHANTGKKGYEWVGWRNETHFPHPIVINFKFDAVRNFSFVYIHTNNMFSKDVRVFKKATIFFKLTESQTSSTNVEYIHHRDSIIEYARNISIPLYHRIGQYVKLELQFDSKWLMISEIVFVSEYVDEDYLDDILGVEETSSNEENFRNITDDPHGIPEPTTEEIMKINKDSIISGSENGSNMPVDNSNDKTEPINRRSLNNEYIGAIIGVLCTVVLLFFIIICFIINKKRKKKYNSNHHTMGPTLVSVPIMSSFDEHISRSTLINEKILNGSAYNWLSHYDESGDDVNKFDNYTPKYELYGTPLNSRKIREAPLTNPNYGPEQVHYNGTPSIGPHYAAIDICTIARNIQGVSGNNVYSVPNEELLRCENKSPPEIRQDQLQFIERIGTGQFGEVHLCKLISQNDKTSTPSGDVNSQQLVAVKCLQRNPSKKARSDFESEIKIMCSIRDPNIVQVMGVITQDEPLCVIVEYMHYGDLNQYLQKFKLENTLPELPQLSPISHGCLIYMASQISSGMKYLEALNIVHRDLATRNCLVGVNYLIKISDFGMSRSLYSEDYYKIESNTILPIRWMAWESIILGKFSTKSDVWSFGVTLWEILSFAKEQPFQNLSDELVIDNASHHHRNNRQAEFLPLPRFCFKEIYDLICECWNREAVQRPTFREINMFLQHKNSGYDPVLNKSH